MACSSSCSSGPHESYGACLRSKNLQVGDPTAHKFNQNVYRAQDEYREARYAGLQPERVSRDAVRQAWKITEATGTPYRADQ